MIELATCACVIDVDLAITFPAIVHGAARSDDYKSSDPSVTNQVTANLHVLKEKFRKSYKILQLQLLPRGCKEKDMGNGVSQKTRIANRDILLGQGLPLRRNSKKWKKEAKNNVRQSFRAGVVADRHWQERVMESIG